MRNNTNRNKSNPSNVINNTNTNKYPSKVINNTNRNKPCTQQVLDNVVTGISAVSKENKISYKLH